MRYREVLMLVIFSFRQPNYGRAQDLRKLVNESLFRPYLMRIGPPIAQMGAWLFVSQFM